jgi:uncharacterized protein
MMTDERKAKYGRLLAILSSCDNILIALSGGLDSSFLLAAAVEAIGADRVYAAIGKSPSLPKADLIEAQRFAAGLGLNAENTLIIETAELENPDYRSNNGQRCYFCKQELYRKLTEVAAGLDIETICDGANASDAGDYRPGMKAAGEIGVKSPLLDAGLNKDEIRELARDRSISVWDRPASACLASRIPYYSEVTAEKLEQVEAAESFLKSLGFRELRVRHHDQVARIELPPADMQRILSEKLGERISSRFRELGFLFTAMDVAGLESGRMNLMLKGGKDG